MEKCQFQNRRFNFTDNSSQNTVKLKTLREQSQASHVSRIRYAIRKRNRVEFEGLNLVPSMSSNNNYSNGRNVNANQIFSNKDELFRYLLSESRNWYVNDSSKNSAENRLDETQDGIKSISLEMQDSRNLKLTKGCGKKRRKLWSETQTETDVILAEKENNAADRNEDSLYENSVHEKNSQEINSIENEIRAESLKYAIQRLQARSCGSVNVERTESLPSSNNSFSCRIGNSINFERIFSHKNKLNESQPSNYNQNNRFVTWHVDNSYYPSLVHSTDNGGDMTETRGKINGITTMDDSISLKSFKDGSKKRRKRWFESKENIQDIIMAGKEYSVEKNGGDGHSEICLSESNFQELDIIRNKWNAESVEYNEKEFPARGFGSNENRHMVQWTENLPSPNNRTFDLTKEKKHSNINFFDQSASSNGPLSSDNNKNNQFPTWLNNDSYYWSLKYSTNNELADAHGRINVIPTTQDSESLNHITEVNKKRRKNWFEKTETLPETTKIEKSNGTMEYRDDTYSKKMSSMKNTHQLNSVRNKRYTEFLKYVEKWMLAKSPETVKDVNIQHNEILSFKSMKPHLKVADESLDKVSDFCPGSKEDMLSRMNDSANASKTIGGKLKSIKCVKKNARKGGKQTRIAFRVGKFVSTQYKDIKGIKNKRSKKALSNSIKTKTENNIPVTVSFTRNGNLKVVLHWKKLKPTDALIAWFSNFNNLMKK